MTIMPADETDDRPTEVGIGAKCPDCGYRARLADGRCVKCAAEAKAREIYDRPANADEKPC